MYGKPITVRRDSILFATDSLPCYIYLRHRSLEFFGVISLLILDKLHFRLSLILLFFGVVMCFCI